MSWLNRWWGTKVEGLLHVEDNLGLRFGATLETDLPVCSEDRDGEVRHLPGAGVMATRIMQCRWDGAGAFGWTTMGAARYRRYVMVSDGLGGLAFVTDNAANPVEVWEPTG